MTFEERLKRYAEKGELVHLSLAFYDGAFHCNLAMASPPSGYSKGVDKDPVVALEKAFADAPVKVRRPSARPEKDAPVTAAVNEPVNEEKTGLPADWTSA